MNYGVILAGGVGNRVKSISMPKQYYEINGIPIIIYTLKRMLEVGVFDYFYVAVAVDYIELMKVLVKKYFSTDVAEKIMIVVGGKERIDTIHNVIKSIKENNNIGDDDVIVIHDAVRPFVTDRILVDSVDGAKKYGATVAAVPVSDTILKSNEGEYVDSIPIRNTLYKGQSPDSFNLKKFIELESKLTDEQKSIITGTSQICTINNFPIRMIDGDNMNFKITTDADLEIARRLILKKED